jgi:hypothetical protein
MYHSIIYVPDGYKFWCTGFNASTSKLDGSAIGLGYFRIMSNYLPELGSITHYMPYLETAVYGSETRSFDAPMVFP